MFNSSDSLENAAEQDGAQGNTDNFLGSHLSVASNVNSPQADIPKSTTTSVLRRWRRKEAQDSGPKHVPPKDPSKEVVSSTQCTTNHDRSGQMNPNAIPSNTFSPGPETVSTGETGCPVFVPHLSPLVPQSTARPYDHSVTRIFDGSGPRVHPDTGAYSRVSPVVQNKIQIAEQQVRYPPALTQTSYYQSETPNRGRSNVFPVIPNISPGSVEHRNNPLQQYNTSNPTSNPNIKGREYAYQNYVAARSPQELRSNLESTKFVSPQNPTEESYPKGNAFIHDVRIIQPAYSTPSDRRSELKSSTNRPSIVYQNEERMNIPAQQHFVPNRSTSSANVTAEYANHNATSLNYYQNKPSCFVQDTRTQNSLYPPDRYPNQLSPQNYNHNYLASKTGQLNLQDSKNAMEYRNIVVPNSSMPGKYPLPYPILERRLESGFGPEQTLHNYQYQRYNLMPNQHHTSKVTVPTAGAFPQSQKGLQNVQSLPPTYSQSRYYPQISNAHEGRIKDFDQNVHLSQLNQMHSRLPLGRSSEMLQNLSYMEQNRHQRSRLYYESQAAMAQKSSKMANYGLQDQRTSDAIQNEYLEMTRSCAAPIKSTDYQRVPNPAVAGKIDIAYDPKHSREYVAHQEYGAEHNYLNEQPSGYHNNHYAHHTSVKPSEMPPRNISPRRTYQENMPIYVVSPPQVSIPNPPSGAYGHPDAPTYPNANSRNIHTSQIKSGQYPPSPTKYPNISPNRTIPPLRHFPGYQENYPRQYYQAQHPNVSEYQDNLIRSQSHYPVNLMAVPNANRNYPGFQNEGGIFEDDRHHRNSQVVSRSTEYNKKGTEMSKSIKEFLESWEDDEESVANLPDLVLCNNLPPEKHKHTTSSCSNSDLEDSVDKSDEKRKANEEAWYIYGRSVIAPEMLQQYLDAFPDRVVDSLPANIKGFYSTINSPSEDPSVVETNVLSASSTDNHDSPSPHDLSVNSNFIMDEVLNLCTKEKENQENTEERNNNLSPNPEEKSITFAENKSTVKEVHNQQESLVEASEKPVAASVIVPNTYFESNRIKSDSQPSKDVSEHFDNLQKSADEEDQNDKTISNKLNESCNENVTMIESQLIDLDKEHLETQFDFDTELLSPEPKEDCALIEDDKLVPEKTIDISLENMLLSPEPIPAFDDTVSISEVLKLDEEEQCASLHEENESDSIRSPSPETTAKYDESEDSLKVMESTKEETKGEIDSARSLSEKVPSNYDKSVKYQESLISPDSEKLIEDSSSSLSTEGSSLSEKSVVCNEIEDVDDIYHKLLQSPPNEESLEVPEENVTSNIVNVPEELESEKALEAPEENISSLESNEEKNLDLTNLPTTDVLEELKNNVSEEMVEVPKEKVPSSEIISDPTAIISEKLKSSATIFSEKNISVSKEKLLTLTTRIIQDTPEDNTLLSGDAEPSGRTTLTEDELVKKLDDKTQDANNLENLENIASSEINEEIKNLAVTSSAGETYETCTTSSETLDTIPCQVEIPYEEIDTSVTEAVAEDSRKDTEIGNLGRLEKNEEEIEIKAEEDDPYLRATPIIMELLPKKSSSEHDFGCANEEDTVVRKSNLEEEDSSDPADLPNPRKTLSDIRNSDSELDDDEKEDILLKSFESKSEGTNTLKTKAALKEIISESKTYYCEIDFKDEDSNYSADTVILEDLQNKDETVEEPVNTEIKIETLNENHVLERSDDVENGGEISRDSLDGNFSNSSEKLVNEIDKILEDSKTNATNKISRQSKTFVTENESNIHEDDETFTIHEEKSGEDTDRSYQFDPVMDSLDTTIKEILNNNDTTGFIVTDPLSDNGDSTNDEADKTNIEDSEEDLDYSILNDKDELFLRIKSTLDPLVKDKISTKKSNIKETSENEKLKGDQNNLLDSTNIVSVDKVLNKKENITIITEDKPEPEEKLETATTSDSFLEQLTTDDLHHQDKTSIGFLENDEDKPEPEEKIQTATTSDSFLEPLTNNDLHHQDETIIGFLENDEDKPEPEEKIETVTTSDSFLEQLTTNDLHHQDKTVIDFLENDDDKPEPEEKIETATTSDSFLEPLTNNDHVEGTQQHFEKIKHKIDKKTKPHSKKHSSFKSVKRMDRSKTYGREKIKKKLAQKTVSFLDKAEEKTENVVTTNLCLERLSNNDLHCQDLTSIHVPKTDETTQQNIEKIKLKIIKKTKSHSKKYLSSKSAKYINMKKNYRTDKIKKSKVFYALAKDKSSKKRLVDRTGCAKLSVCDSADSKLEKPATNKIFEKICDIPNSFTKLSTDSLSEFVEEDALNVQIVIVNGQDEMKKSIVESETVRDKQVKKYLHSEDSSNKTETVCGKEEDDEYQHLVTLTDSFDCDDSDVVVENSSIEEDILKQTNEENPSDDNQTIQPEDPIVQNSSTVITETISTEAIEEISVLTLELIQNETDFYSSDDKMEVILPNVIISDDMISQNLSQSEDQIEIILPSDNDTSQCLILNNENDSGIVLNDSFEDNVEEIVDDYIGGEVVIGDDGIGDWVSEEIEIDDMGNVQDKYSSSERTEEMIEEQFNDLMVLNTNFIEAEILYSSKCLEFKISESDESDKEKELFINPENPVKVFSCLMPIFPLCNSPHALKRRVSIAGVDSPKIEYTAPKRRYSEMEVVRSSKQLSFNLDEIKQTVTDALETITKRETMQYKCGINSAKCHRYTFKNKIKVTGSIHFETLQSNVDDNNTSISQSDKPETNCYSNIKQESLEPDISDIDVPLLHENLDQVHNNVNHHMEPMFASSYNQNNLHTNALKNNQLQVPKDLVNITNNSKSSTFDNIASSVESLNTSTKSLPSPITTVIASNSEPIVSSIEEKMKNTLLPLTKEEFKKPFSSLVIDEQKKLNSSFSVEATVPLRNPNVMSNGCETRRQLEVFKNVGPTNEKICEHSITLKFAEGVKKNEPIERIKLVNGEKKCKINLEVYRNRKQNNCNGIKEEIVSKVEEKNMVCHNEKMLEKYVEHEDEIEEPKTNVIETKITINNKLTLNNLVSTKDSPKVDKPKRRKRRFRNLDASEEDEEGVPSKEGKSVEFRSIDNAVPDGRSSKDSSRNLCREDSYSCNNNSVRSENNDNGEHKLNEISSMDLNANDASVENNCPLKCHIKWKSIQNDPSIICDYKINKHKNRNISKLKLTLKPVRKEQIFSEVLSSLDSVVEKEVLVKKKKSSSEQVIKSKWAMDSNNKVPKVIIKRNASGYCAVSRDVSSNPAWQPTISLKRQKFIEALLHKNKKIRPE